MTPYRKQTGSSERGVALIIALLVLLLITAVGIGMIIMSNTETNVSSNFRDEQTAYFAAKAGIEEVRDRLRAGAANSLLLPTTLASTLPGAPSGILYVINPLGSETVAPWLLAGSNYPDNELVKELNCTGTAPTGAWWVPVSPTASTSYAAAPILQWKWVRVMEKINKSDTGCTLVTSVDGTTNGNRVCWTGKHEVATILSLAVTSSGSRRMMQYEVAQNAFPTIPGAFVFDGSQPSFNPPNSGAFSVSGADTNVHPGNVINGVTCPVPVNQPALGSFDDPATSTLTTAVQGNGVGNDRSSQYSSAIPYATVPASDCPGDRKRLYYYEHRLCRLDHRGRVDDVCQHDHHRGRPQRLSQRHRPHERGRRDPERWRRKRHAQRVNVRGQPILGYP